MPLLNRDDLPGWLEATECKVNVSHVDHRDWKERLAVMCEMVKASLQPA